MGVGEADEGECGVAGLPDELALLVLGQLPVADLLRARAVCRAWSSLATDTALWQSLLQRHFGVRVHHPRPPAGPVDGAGPAQAAPHCQDLAWPWACQRHLAAASEEERERAGATAMSLYSRLNTAVYGGGSNAGPTDWGVPTPPTAEGELEYGQVLGSPTAQRRVFGPIFADRRRVIKQVDCGGFHSMMVDGEGRCYAMGANGFGQLGLGHRRSMPHAALVELPRPGACVAKVVCGYAFTMLLTPTGALFACGFNQNGRLGIPDAECRDTTADGDWIVLAPQRVMATLGRSVEVIACGSAHCVAALRDGTVVAWGRNDCGQVGAESRKGEAVDAFTIRCAHTESQWRACSLDLPPLRLLSCSGYTSVAVTKDNDFYCWGSGGVGTVARDSKVVQIPRALSAQPCRSISAGPASVAVSGAGRVFMLQRTEVFAIKVPEPMVHAELKHLKMVLVSETGRLYIHGLHLPDEFCSDDLGPMFQAIDGSHTMFKCAMPGGTTVAQAATGHRHLLVRTLTVEPTVPLAAPGLREAPS